MEDNNMNKIKHLKQWVGYMTTRYPGVNMVLCHKIKVVCRWGRVDLYKIGPYSLILRPF